MNNYNQNYCAAIWSETVNDIGEQSRGKVGELFDTLAPFNTEIDQIEMKISTAIIKGDVDTTKKRCSEWKRAHFWALSKCTPTQPTAKKQEG